MTPGEDSKPQSPYLQIRETPVPHNLIQLDSRRARTQSPSLVPSSSQDTTSKGSVRQRIRLNRAFSCDDDEREVEAAALRGLLVPLPSASGSGLHPKSSSTPIENAEVDEDLHLNGEDPPSSEDNPSSMDQDRLQPSLNPVHSQDEASITSSDEEFTLRDRQNAINRTHPFGIRIWKPALYKKRRGIEQGADDDIHSLPNQIVPWPVIVGNIIWSMTYGLVLGVICWVASTPLIFMSPFSRPASHYSHLLRQLARYFVWPFGKYIQLVHSDNYRDEDDGHGRSVADYLAWQEQRIPSQNDNNQGDSHPTSRLFFAPRPRRPSMHHDGHPIHQPLRLFGRGKWSIARVIFYLEFYLLIVPGSLFISALCWLGVFSLPMARVVWYVLEHLRIHPLSLCIKTTNKFTDEEATNQERFSIILCTYRAFGLKYYKYTVGGSNVILINLLAAVAVTILDFYVYRVLPEWAVFALSLASIIPLAHFIGQSVASISAQSSMSMGATINAFFSTVVEVYLYLVALKQGKGELVEGSITGSVLAGVLLMPGLSMCAGALKRKTQRFNPKSQGATSTMLMFSVIGVLAPTLFYTMYGPSRTICDPNCVPGTPCKCWSDVVPLEKHHHAYQRVIQPFSIICAVCLFIAYAAGLLFTLRTHAALIWAQTAEEENEGSHEGPNWGRRKSYVILLSATWLYAMIAEVLVGSADFVLEHVQISQRMLGITVFALVPNTTEFLNAISFAMQGNVALSLEIGSAYALQVCLLQIPALVLWGLRNVDKVAGKLRDYVFILVLPKWDVWAWVICILLYIHVHAEGKSNYFKGTMLILAYLVLVCGFYFDDVVFEGRIPSAWPVPPVSASIISSLVEQG